MTNHTEAERAEFELMREAYEKAFGPPPVGAAWASVGYAIKTHEASEARAYAERFKGFVGGWVWRSAQAAPVPTEQQILDAAEKAGLWPNTVHTWISAFKRYHAALSAAPQPPEAEQSNSPEFDGIKPDAFQTEGGLKSEIRTTSTAPVQMPEPAGCVVYANGESHHWDANRECAELFASSERSRGAPYAFTFENLYTEQQVRQLLADNGIGKDKA